jgi:hypothetical protein
MDAEEPVGDGAEAILFYAFVASPWHSDDSCLKFARKRNSGLRTQATAVALKLLLPSHYSLSNFGDHHYGNSSNNDCDPQPPSRWFGNSGL